MMYKIAASFAVTLIWTIVIPNIIVEYDHFCDWLDERHERNELITNLERDYQIWYTIAAKEADPLEKGYAIAKLIIISHEIETINKKKSA